MKSEQIWNDKKDASSDTECEKKNAELWTLIHIDKHEQSCTDILMSEQIWESQENTSTSAEIMQKKAEL